MADAYSSWQSSTKEADGGYNVTMSLRIIRGVCTKRTATSVSFKFGVELQSNQKFNNSISVFYGKDKNGNWLNKRYAFHNPGYTKSQLEASGEWGTRPLAANKSVYACWPEADTSGWQYQYSEYYCYTYTNDKISASTTSVDITIGGAWDAHTPSNSAKMTRTFSIAIPKFIGPVGTGTTTITDNYNNSFTITATKGTDGTNNTAGGPDTLKWGYDTNYSNSYTNDGRRINLTISGTGATRTVYAKSRTTAADGNHKTSTTSAAIRQYVGPDKIASCGISSSKGKLTLKEDWILHWTEPNINNGCPIKGYQVALFKQSSGDNKWSALPLINDKGDILIGSTGKYQTEGTSLSLKLGAKYYTKEYNALGTDLLKPGDKIKFSVKAYTKFGKNHEINSFVFNNNANIETYSTEYPIYNSGIMRVKANNAWTEGQVWVKVDGNWKEADVVKVKVNGVWEDSE